MPVASPAQSSVSLLCKSGFVLTLFFITLAITAPAQTFTKLADFDGSNGNAPRGALTQGTDGTLYGAAREGGSSLNCPSGCGVIFNVTTGGTITPIHSFDGTDGSHPNATPVLGSDGNFYGTTYNGGGHSRGTVFQMQPDGTVATIYSFEAATGENPAGGLVLAGNGKFYGTTNFGGKHNAGNIFSVSSAGTFKVIYSFCAQTGCPDGQNANDGLIQGSDGNFYGTMPAGGTGKFGTIFKVTPAGMLTTLYTFCSETNCADGASPYPTLVQGNEGSFYGTTFQGGTHNNGVVYRIGPKGAYQVLHNFCALASCPDGANPAAGLALGTDGNLYGTTTASGVHSRGTIFQISKQGAFKILYTFLASDGQFPGQLTQATDGNFYGTMQVGGTSGDGSFFSLANGLGPFVKTVPSVGKIGSSVIILGSDLTGASSVTFNGTSAAFNVVSAPEISATVPTGATTGSIQVVTPSGTLTSNISFHVLP